MSNQSATAVESSNVSTSSRAESPVPVPSKKSKHVHEVKLSCRRLIIIVTPTSTKDQFQGVFLRELANTTRLVPQPLLLIVIERHSNTNEVSELPRKTGIMYRHLVLNENFTDPEAELNHQRNVALNHIEQHKLSGIVHFAGLSHVYDLDFFKELRQVEVFGTRPMAILSANKRKVVIGGPVCDSSQLIGWHLRKMNKNNHTDEKTDEEPNLLVGFNYKSPSD